MMDKTRIVLVEDNADVGVPNAGGVFARKKGLRRYIGPKRVVLIILFGVAVGFSWHLYRQGIFRPEMLSEWIVAYPFASVAIFVLIYAFSVVAVLPTLPFNLAAGFFWGPVWGGVITTIGCSFGSIVAFCAARFLFGQPLARRFDHRMVFWLQHEFEKKGWRFIAFVRINPIFPTSVLNYIFGLTSVRFVTYMWATILFLLPPSLLFAMVGHEVGTFVIDGASAHLVHNIIVVSIVVTIIVGLRVLTKYLNQERDILP